MPRATQSSEIGSASARDRLQARPKPYWRGLEEGLHLGYRKPKGRAGGGNSGSWLARFRTRDGAYREQVIGTADDRQAADGEAVLTFAQAQAKARLAFVERERAALGVEEQRTGPYTVADALNDYEADFVRRGKKAILTVRGTAATHILPALGDVEVTRLSADRIRRWHAALADAHAMVRTKKGKERARRPHAVDDGDAVRRRRSSANRILTVLKAALNLAYADGRVANADAWRRVKPFRGVEGARVRWLTVEEAGAFLSACDDAFRPLAEAALLTGLRYGELRALNVADVDLRGGSVFVAESKSGKSRHVPLTADGMTLFERLTFGRTGREPVFVRETFRRGQGRGSNERSVRAWAASEGRPCMEVAWRRAGLDAAVTFHELRHTYASHLVGAGVPLAFVAEALGHSDTRITSKHYAHLAPNAIADAVRAALPRFSAQRHPKPSRLRSESNCCQ